MYASPMKKSENQGPNRQLAVKRISKEEYSHRMDIPKNDPGMRSSSVEKKTPNKTIDLSKFGLSDTKNKSPENENQREPRKTIVSRNSRSRVTINTSDRGGGNFDFFPHDSWRDDQNSFKPSLRKFEDNDENINRVNEYKNYTKSQRSNRSIMSQKSQKSVLEKFLVNKKGESRRKGKDSVLSSYKGRLSILDTFEGKKKDVKEESGDEDSDLQEEIELMKLEKKKKKKEEESGVKSLKKEIKNLKKSKENLEMENEMLRDRLEDVSDKDDFEVEKMKEYVANVVAQNEKLTKENQDLIKRLRNFGNRDEESNQIKITLLGIELMRLVKVIREYDQSLDDKKNKIKHLEMEKKDILKQLEEKKLNLSLGDSDEETKKLIQEKDNHIQDLKNQLENILSVNQKNLEALKFKRIGSEKMKKRIDELMMDNIVCKMQIEKLSKTRHSHQPSGEEDGERMREMMARYNHMESYNKEITLKYNSLKVQNEEQEKFAKLLDNKVSEMAQALQRSKAMELEVNRLKLEVEEKNRMLESHEMLNRRNFARKTVNPLQHDFELVKSTYNCIMNSFSTIKEETEGYYDCELIKLKSENLLNRIESLESSGTNDLNFEFGESNNDLNSAKKNKIDGFLKDQNLLFEKISAVLQKFLSRGPPQEENYLKNQLETIKSSNSQLMAENKNLKNQLQIIQKKLDKIDGSINSPIVQKHKQLNLMMSTPAKNTRYSGYSGSPKTDQGQIQIINGKPTRVTYIRRQEEPTIHNRSVSEKKIIRRFSPARTTAFGSDEIKKRNDELELLCQKLQQVYIYPSDYEALRDRNQQLEVICQNLQQCNSVPKDYDGVKRRNRQLEDEIRVLREVKALPNDYENLKLRVQELENALRNGGYEVQVPADYQAQKVRNQELERLIQNLQNTLQIPHDYNSLKARIEQLEEINIRLEQSCQVPEDYNSLKLRISEFEELCCILLKTYKLPSDYQACKERNHELENMRKSQFPEAKTPADYNEIKARIQDLEETCKAFQTASRNCSKPRDYEKLKKRCLELENHMNQIDRMSDEEKRQLIQECEKLRGENNQFRNRIVFLENNVSQSKPPDDYEELKRKVFQLESASKIQQHQPADFGMNNDLEILKRERDELRIKNQKLQDDFNELLQNREDLRKEMDQIGNRLVDKQNELERARLSSRTEGSVGMNTLRGDNEDLRNIINSKEREIVDLEDEKSELQSKVDILENQMEDKNRTIQELEYMMNESNKQIALLKKDISHLQEKADKSDLEEEIRRLREEREGLYKELNERKDEEFRMKQQLEADINSKKEEIFRLEQKLKIEITDVSNELQDARKKNHEFEMRIEELENIIKKLESENDKKDENISELVKEKNKLLKEVDEKEEELSNLKRGQDRLDEEVEELQKSLDFKQGILDSLKEQYENQIKALQEKLKKLGEKDHNFSKEISNLENRIEELTEELDNLKKKHEETNQELEELRNKKSEFEEQEIKLKEMIASLEDQLAKSNQESLHLENERNELEDKLDQVLRDLESLRRQHEELERTSHNNEEQYISKINQLKLQCGELGEELMRNQTELEKTREALRDIRNSMDEELRTVLQENSMLKGDNNSLKNRVEELKEDKRELKTEIEKLSEKIEILSQQIKDRDYSISQLREETSRNVLDQEKEHDRELTVLRKICEDLKHNLQNSTTQNENLKTRITELQEENSQLKGDLASKGRRLDELEEGVRILEEKLSKRPTESQYNELKLKLEQAVSDIEYANEKMKRKDEDFESEYSRLEKYIHEKESIFNEKENHFKQKEKEFLEKETSFRERENDYKEKINRFENEIEDLRSQLKRIREMEEQLQEFESLKRKYIELEKDQEKLIGQNIDLKNSLKEKSIQYEHLQNMYEELKDRFNEVKDLYDGLKNEKSKEINEVKKINRFINKLNPIIKSVQILKHSTENIKRDNDHFRKEFGANLQSVSELFNSEAEIAPRGTLEKLKKLKKNDSEDFRKKFEEQKNLIENLERETDILREENQTIKNALLAAEYKLEQYQHDIEEYESQIDEKDDLIEKLKQDLLNYRDQLLKCEKNLNDLAAEREEFFNFRKSVIDGKKSSEIHIKELEIRIEEYVTEINILRNKNGEYDLRLKSVRDEFESLKNQINILERENEELRHQLEESVNEVEMLRVQLEEESFNKSHSRIDESLVNQLREQIKILKEKVEIMSRFQPEPCETLDVFLDASGRKVYTRHKTYDQLKLEREEGLDLITQLTLKLHEIEKIKESAITERDSMEQELEECKYKINKMSERISSFRHLKNAELKIGDLKEQLDHYVGKYKEKTQEVEKLRRVVGELKSNKSSKSNKRNELNTERLVIVRKKTNNLMGKMDSLVRDLEYIEVKKMNHPKPSYVAYREKFKELKSEFEMLCEESFDESVKFCQININLYENLEKQLKKRKNQLYR